MINQSDEVYQLIGNDNNDWSWLRAKNSELQKKY
jgi:hypothetical protein